MKKQINLLFTQFMTYRSKISHNCKKTFTFANCLHYNIDNYITKLAEMMTELAKRVYVYQLKTTQYIEKLSKYIDVGSIECKYEEITPIDVNILNQLINTEHTFNYDKIEENIINVQGQSLDQQLNEDDLSLDPAQEQYQYDSHNTDATIKQSNRIQERKHNRHKYNSYHQQAAAINQMQANNQQYSFKHRPKITISTLTPQHTSRKHRRGLPYKNQTYQIQNGNMRQSEMYPYMANNRVQISLQNDIIQQNKRIQEIQSKQERKLRVREEWQMISNFVQNYLQQRLQYSQDHRSHSIPKKLILNYYFGWCKQRNRKIVVHKQSVIQMALTNQLKLAFPGVDVYTNNYRGLYFNKNENKNNEAIPPIPNNTFAVKEQNYETFETLENGVESDNKEE